MQKKQGHINVFSNINFLPLYGYTKPIETQIQTPTKQ
jgi:hypothetical protein